MPTPYSPSGARAELSSLRAQETHLRGTISFLENERRRLEGELQRLDLEKSKIDRAVHATAVQLDRVKTNASSENNLLVQVRSHIRNLEASGVV